VILLNSSVTFRLNYAFATVSEQAYAQNIIIIIIIINDYRLNVIRFHWFEELIFWLHVYADRRQTGS